MLDGWGMGGGMMEAGRAYATKDKANTHIKEMGHGRDRRKGEHKGDRRECD